MDHREALAGQTEQTRGWMAGICAAGRVENQAAAAQLVAIGGLFADRLARSAETEDWAIDTMEAVAAEVAAGLRISQRRAQTKLHWARAMRERVPKVGALFAAGEIDFCAFATVVSRTELLTDPEVLARVDGLIAANLTRWPSLTAGRLGGKVDSIVAQVDADAVRRRQERAAGRRVEFTADHDGVTYVEGALFTPDARALEERLSALAATVCPQDPRSPDQRRADALGALAGGADRLGCRCGRTECTAGKRTAAAPTVIHVIAEQAALDGRPGLVTHVCAEGLITPEILAELAAGATQVPLIHPGYRPPEPGHVPSKALADFVRCRDLTCRWPGCDVPATRCDVDHTIPYAQGGPTHAGNLKCYCRTHHLVKTFWGWREKQLADGTLILTSPAGDTHVTTPGSALLFPSLCAAVGGMPSPETDTPLPADYCAERTAMMPKRRRTRAQDRAARIAAERRHNRQARLATRTAGDVGYLSHAGPAPPDDEPPPF
nr:MULTISPECIES: HNH endonuclease signature motif containing protein [Mycobacterium]